MNCFQLEIQIFIVCLLCYNASSYNEVDFVQSLIFAVFDQFINICECFDNTIDRYNLSYCIFKVAQAFPHRKCLC